MISFLIFLFILGLLILVHEFGHFIAAKRIGVKVEDFSLGFGPHLVSLKKGDTQYSLSLIPLGGYVKLAGDNLEEYKGRPDEYLSHPPAQRAKIIFFGPILNYVLGFLCFWLILFAGYPTLTTKVGGLIDGFGAKDAGLRIGDQITEVDGKKVAYWEDLQKIIYQKKPLQKVRVSILRDNQESFLEIEIRQKKIDDPLGQKQSVGLLGVTPKDEIVKVRHGFFKSFFLSLSKTWDLTILTYKSLWRMATGKLSLRESVSGPLGIFFITSQAASLGIIALLHLIAVLNISLGIFNLLPLPVLDGGHLVLLYIERLRQKSLGLKAERMLNQIGITFIIALAGFVTYNDIVRNFGDKISKFLNR